MLLLKAALQPKFILQILGTSNRAFWAWNWFKRVISGKLVGWGLKAVWDFSKKISDLVVPPFPKTLIYEGTSLWQCLIFLDMPSEHISTDFHICWSSFWGGSRRWPRPLSLNACHPSPFRPHSTQHKYVFVQIANIFLLFQIIYLYLARNNFLTVKFSKSCRSMILSQKESPK